MSDATATPPLPPQETPKAAQAFADYVEMGPSRSLRALADQMVKQGQYKTSATALAQLSAWSSKFHWQERLRKAITERTTALLEEAAELDAATFLSTSREYRRRSSGVMIQSMKLDDIHNLRGQVRSKESTVNVKHSGTIRTVAEKLAAEIGVTADELIAEAERLHKEAGG